MNPSVREHFSSVGFSHYHAKYCHKGKRKLSWSPKVNKKLFYHFLLHCLLLFKSRTNNLCFQPDTKQWSKLSSLTKQPPTTMEIQGYTNIPAFPGFFVVITTHQVSDHQVGDRPVSPDSRFVGKGNREDF